MTELRGLTIARGVAAWLVVLYHIRLSIAGLPAPLVAALGKGYLAVDFFFLLSGFVIWLAWHERLRDGGAQAVARFWQRRIARIWPLHAVMLTAAAALALLLAATGRADPAFPGAELPLHILLVQNWGLTSALHWNDPAWSISCELAAYLLFPLLATAVDWRRLRTATLLALAAALLLTLHLAMRDQPGLGTDIPRFGLVRCLTEFATGTIVAALWLRVRTVAPSIIAAALSLIAWIAGAPETLVVPAAFAASLLALAKHQTRRPSSGNLESTLHRLGEISYATYLSHYLLWKFFKLTLVRDATAVPPSLIALYLLIVLAASAGLYRYVEKPAQRWINALPVRRPLPRVLPRAR
ncbi:acyltransferase family protein [Sphingomonas sp. Tas61C01]|uniref:acyltransferase family protein n=1 Tax=Sphingomonas sp. Tas61C01 TaxID=3458297 RepID=UPI00403E9B9F